jgi:hypothetical protein
MQKKLFIEHVGQSSELEILGGGRGKKRILQKENIFNTLDPDHKLTKKYIQNYIKKRRKYFYCKTKSGKYKTKKRKTRRRIVRFT